MKGSLSSYLEFEREYCTKQSLRGGVREDSQKALSVGKIPDIGVGVM